MAKIQGVHYPAELKNLAINGGMDYFQRYESTSLSVAGASGSAYVADMFYSTSGGTTTKTFNIARSTNVPTLAQSGYLSNYSLAMTNTAAVSSFAASDYTVPLQYRMEGLDYQKIHGKQITIGFWVYATVVGVYTLHLSNIPSAITRSYLTTFTVAASNSWQFVTTTIQLETINSNYAFGNAADLGIIIGAVTGSNYQSSTLNAWQNSSYFMASNAVNWMATAGAVLQVAQFSIVEGPLGFSATGFQRAGKDIQQELALCQRYYEKSYDIGTTLGTVTQVGCWATTTNNTSGAIRRVTIKFSVKKRTVPSPAVYNTNGTGAVGTVSFDTASPSTAISSYQMVGTDGFGYEVSNPGTESRCYAQWTADAGL